MIGEAVTAVRAGKVIGLPTDTVYGLGADPFDEDAVGALFDLKGRPVGKPIGVLVAKVEQADAIGELSGLAKQLAEAHWPGALTLVVTPRVVMADWVGDKQLLTLGLRVPDHSRARELLELTGPLAVTSANRSGQPEAMSDLEARDIFGDAVAVYVKGVSPGGVASTVVDATGDGLRVLRQGPIQI